MSVQTCSSLVQQLLTILCCNVSTVLLVPSARPARNSLLCDALLFCSCALQSLDLSWNEIRGEGATAIAELVRENNFLKRLVLASNGLSDDGAAALGRSLATNAGLRELDLSSNRIGLRGAAPLAKALLQNEALETLRVRRRFLITTVQHCSIYYTLFCVNPLLQYSTLEPSKIEIQLKSKFN